jgi:O-antigen ligase
MSFRVLACFAYVAYFSYYAWQNPRRSACAAVLLMAVFQHPDMPKSIFGIQGMNPWNILAMNVVGAWLSQRRQSGYAFDLPRSVAFAMCLFGAVMMFGYVRLAMDPAYLEDYTFASGFSEYVVNNLKWLIFSVILFDTTRSRRDVINGLLCVVGLYLVLAIQVIRWVPLRFAVAAGTEFAYIAYKLIQNEIGYNRVTLSVMLGGASWATLAFFPLITRTKHRYGLLAAFFLITLGQALTGGRTGYLTWAAVGLFFCGTRWRKLLLVVPVAIFVVPIFLPAVKERMLMGLGGAEGQTNSAQVTSGRTAIWPHVIKKIGSSPLIGYGRLSMQRTGLTDWLLENIGEDNFGHPHNAYLEQLLDSGIIGLFATLLLFGMISLRSFGLFYSHEDPVFALAGGVAWAIILALLLGSMGGQTFYPREGSAGMWAAIGIMLRVSVERDRMHTTGEPVFDETYDEVEVLGPDESVPSTEQV